MFTGTYTAIVTPFKNGEIDADALRRLVRAQVSAGVDGIVAVGTTGECATLDYEEHIEVIAYAVEFAAGKIKVIAGTGSNSTSEAICLTKGAEKVGADATLQIAPYYNKPTQEGLYQHFLEISRATKLPIILYNIPSRTCVEIAVETVRRLAAATPRIVGVKESGGNPDRITQLRAALGRQFTLFCGDDSLTVPFMSLGAHGVISAASNVIPRPIVQMVRAASNGDFVKARKLHDQYHPLFRDLFIETNPIPVKAALAMMGQMEEEYRLPMVPMNPKNRETLKATLVRCGVLPK
jgi:4-hydroxy-tetrahydrodipicolinate synthase